MSDIPEVRGPFSFLTDIGSAAEKVIGAKSKEELRRREEQQQQAQMLQQLIASGSVDPSQLLGPQVGGFYAASGGIDPTKLSNAPYVQKQEAAKQAPMQTQSAALTLKDQMQHTEALQHMGPDQLNEFYKIPGEIDVATADDSQLHDIAKRYVYAAKGDANAAYAAAQLQSTGLTRQKLSREFFGQAAAEYANEQKELDAKMMQASRMYNNTKQPQEMLDDYIRANVAQQNVIQQELAKMPMVDLNPQMKRQRAYLQKELSQYMAQAQLLNAKMTTMMGIQTAPGMTQPPAGQPAPGADPVVETAKQALANKQITPADVMSSKRLTDAQKKAVLGAGYTPTPMAQPGGPPVASPSGGLQVPVVDAAAEKKKKKAASDKKFTDTLGLK